MSTATESIVRFVHDLEFKDIPETVIEDAKLHILDGLGVTFPASLEKNTVTLLRIVKQLEGNTESTVLVFGEKTSRSNAALMNGMMMGTTLDFDDLHVGAGLHPTTVVLPPVLAAAEVARTSG